MQFENDFLRKIMLLNSDSNKMLVLNGRYYCELAASQTTLEVPEHYYYFSEQWKEANFPGYTSYTDCYVHDTAKIGQHETQFGKIYRTVHTDLNDMVSFSLMLSKDKAQITVVSIEIIDKAYPFNCITTTKKEEHENDNRS